MLWSFAGTYNPCIQFVSEKEIFLGELKIARVTPIIKAGDESEMGNYRPISVPPCFPKILKRIMCNRLFKYLTANEILYKNNLVLEKGRSTEHVTIQLTVQIKTSFEKNHFILGEKTLSPTN